MLVEDKFIFLSIPRCSSTAFQIACLKSGFDIKFAKDGWDKIIYSDYERVKNIDDNEKLADGMNHSHEALPLLEQKFGNNYPVVSVFRDKYERFISLYKHIIDECYLNKENEFAEVLQKLTIEEVLSVDNKYLMSHRYEEVVVEDFFKRHGQKIKSRHQYVKIMLSILFRPTSYWHNHDPRIVWFDISELEKLEEWVRNITNKPFKIEKINSSQHFECNFVLDKKFIHQYNRIYSMYDIQKSEKSLV